MKDITTQIREAAEAYTCGNCKKEIVFDDYGFKIFAQCDKGYISISINQRTTDSFNYAKHKLIHACKHDCIQNSWKKGDGFWAFYSQEIRRSKL